MALSGRVFRQTTLTGETTQDTQSVDDSNNLTHKGRGKTRGKGLEKMKKTLGSKMKIEIPLGKGRPTKPDQSAKLSNELGIIARNFLLLPNKWKELTREDKDTTLIRCHERFEINLDEHYVKDSCENILKNRSRQWRYKLKKLFESAHSEEEARKIEVPELTPKNWNRLCDMWINPHHKLKSNHFMGSKALVASRAAMGGTKPEGVEPDRIEFYKHTHYTSEKGWYSLHAETHYNNMIDLKDIYTSGESSMTIDEIVDIVLGTKLGYIKGLGYGPKPNTTRATQRRTAELGDSLKKAKQEAASAQHDLQKRLNANLAG
ncbi:hypothetical protein H5410_047213 [Solanum commersonii]|uniref:Transposase, Ptta/En/Spm, plant n=1 Tax=Solanum commersonii TaxID=4109 RepID=A0A9J5XEI1_SOLCO|nr:hypothetical protein H5410_047213 [Solanum commersonii]